MKTDLLDYAPEPGRAAAGDDVDGYEYETSVRMPLIASVTLGGIGQALIEARAACGLPIDDLASRIGVEGGWLRRCEAAGYAGAPLSLLTALERELPVRLEITVMLERD